MGRPGFASAKETTACKLGGWWRSKGDGGRAGEEALEKRVSVVVTPESCRGENHPRLMSKTVVYFLTGAEIHSRALPWTAMSGWYSYHVVRLFVERERWRWRFSLVLER